MTTILSALTLHNLLCACIGAAVYAILSALFSRLDRQIRHQLRKWEKASPEYRNRQRLLRQQSRERMERILAETNDPWAAPMGR